jgi:hypothetical protein
MINALYKIRNQTKNKEEKKIGLEEDPPKLDLFMVGFYLQKVEKMHEYASPTIVQVFDAIFEEDLDKIKRILDFKKEYDLKKYFENSNRNSKTRF